MSGEGRGRRAGGCPVYAAILGTSVPLWQACLFLDLTELTKAFHVFLPLCKHRQTVATHFHRYTRSFPYSQGNMLPHQCPLATPLASLPVPTLQQLF